MTVKDTGTGMTDEVKIKIFEPFFTTKMAGKGTGVGIATCYGIATKAGGHIEVETQLEEGTSFHVYFPIVDSVTDNDVHVDPDRGNIAIGRETVLLVEDEALVREGYAVTLRNPGCHVLEASNGAEVLRVVEENLNSGIALLFTDVVMPFMGASNSHKRSLTLFLPSKFCSRLVTRTNRL